MRSVAKKLCTLASQGNLRELQRLYSDGFDLACCDYDGRTALHLAASEGHLEVVQWLLTNGARPNCYDRFGGSPLEDASREKHAEVARLLAEWPSKHASKP